MLKILDLALRLPGATMRVPSPPLWVWFFYAIAAVALIVAIHKRKTVVCFGSIAAIVAIQVMGILKSRRRRRQINGRTHKIDCCSGLREMEGHPGSAR